MLEQIKDNLAYCKTVTAYVEQGNFVEFNQVRELITLPDDIQSHDKFSLLEGFYEGFNDELKTGFEAYNSQDHQGRFLFYLRTNQKHLEKALKLLE